MAVYLSNGGLWLQPNADQPAGWATPAIRVGPPPHLAPRDALTCESVDLGACAGVHVGRAFFERGGSLARHSRLIVLEFQLRRDVLVLPVQHVGILRAPETPPFDQSTRMWANAQRDGRPAEYRWRPLFNAAKFG